MRTQIAALPLRRTAAGTLEIVLITSRETGRWVIPKGWPMKGLKDHKAAGREAFEEAGLLGRMRKDEAGRYRYWKRGAKAFELCEVTVYPMAVEGQAPDWPEKGQRQIQWFGAPDAAMLVDEPGLRVLIEGYERMDGETPRRSTARSGLAEPSDR